MPTAHTSQRLSVDNVILAWLADRERRNLSRNSLRNYDRSLRAWRCFLAGHTISTATGSRPADCWDADASLVRAWQQSMRDSELRPATINHALSCVSSFYAFALETRHAPAHLTSNPILANIIRDHVEEYREALTLSPEEYDRLLAYLESHSHTLQGARAHALIRTFLHTGWRAGELLLMRWGDLRPSRVHARTMLVAFRDRAGAVRDDILPRDCHLAILHYLDLAGRAPKSLAPAEFLWTPIREPDTSGFGASVDASRPICGKTALRVLRTHLRAAGIENADRFRLHDLRHTHARLLIESGASLPAIQQRLRHTLPSTTARYLRRTFQNEPAADHTLGFAALRSPGD